MSVKQLAEQDFENEVLKSEGTVLVDFFATWCGPCKMMSPVIDEIADERTDVRVYKVDVDEADEVAMQLGIMSIPTIMVFKNGEATKTFVGVTDKDEITAAL
ncbi:MAG: thioredoxin [Ruminococcaceae bacterium]|jgi:thioredoxin 1|nr:thioredoxin [Oscillospiraceae bacterium]